jgi:muramoyltetrapeptide carboxypeptidase
MRKKKVIGIFATSSPLTRKKGEGDFSYLKSKGFDVVESTSLRKLDGHTAGSVEDRVRDLHNMVENPDINILMAYWGGANTNQLLPYLDYNLFKKYNKPIIGYSDTSALLLAVNKLSKIKTYMGPAGITFDKPQPIDYSYKYFENIIINPKESLIIEDSDVCADDLYFLNPDPTKRDVKKNKGRKVFNHGKTRGKVIASNLQTLLVLAGTSFFPNLQNKILFVEEDENADTQMTHRFFTHLSQVVKLNTLKGICIGRFAFQTGFNDKDTEESMYKDIFKNIDIPIIYNLDFGHTDPLFTIPLGGEVEIDTAKNLIKMYR